MILLDIIIMEKEPTEPTLFINCQICGEGIPVLCSFSPQLNTFQICPDCKQTLKEICDRRKITREQDNGKQ